MVLSSQVVFVATAIQLALLTVPGVVSSSPTHSSNRAVVSGNATVNYKSMAAGTMDWWSCDGDKVAEGTECGYIIVPKDYFNASAGVAKVALVRYNATTSPRKGMILFNPGGPGGSGTQMVIGSGPYLQEIVGEGYDVVGFDPRGVGHTEPATKCFPGKQYYSFKHNTVLDLGFDVGGNLTDPRLRQSLLRQQQEANALYRTEFALCGKTMGEELKYMGTTTVVRDIDFMTTMIEGEDALINFYGLSYGTILGMYLVNMLPDRVGRVVIDGVADPVAWSNEPNYKWYRTWLSSTEDTYNDFLEGCSKAGPSVCGLANSTNEDPSSIRTRIESFFDSLYDEPLPAPEAGMPGIVTSGLARSYLLTTLTSPQSWASAARALSLAMQGNGRQAVSCNDAIPIDPADAASNQVVIGEFIDDLANVTRFTMSVVTTEPDSGCQYWPVRPPERFSGPWNHTLKNPILIHSNTADPVTPISSGRLVKELLGDSARLAIQDGPGHCSFALPSNCTISITRAYFANGTLPDNEHMCPVDHQPFQLGHTEAHSSESGRLFTVVAEVGDAVRRARLGFSS